MNGSSSESNNLNPERIMNSDHKAVRSLREIEMEVLEEGREWTRRRLEQRLQEEANRHGGVFPPQRAKGAPPQAPDDASAQRGWGR
jgi:hypothetical protein